MHWKLPTEVKSVQAGWLAGRAEAGDAMQEADPVEHCDVTLRSRYIRLASEWSHTIPSQHFVQARIKEQYQDQGYIGLIPFSANTLSKHGLPHPPTDPPLVPRQPHHPPHPAQRRSFKGRPPPTRGEEKVRTVVVFYTERRAHTKLSKRATWQDRISTSLKAEH